MRPRHKGGPFAGLRAGGVGHAVRGYIRPYVPRRMSSGIRWAFGLFRRPVLAYLELHLTDTCNLNCKGCSHFCPLAPPQYADLSAYKSDLHRLSQLFRNISTIRLMGGEPLLHPDPASFVIATRAAFPQAQIRFVTNGILLPKASPAFWDACRDTLTTVDLTVYPPWRDRVADLRSLCDAQGVGLYTTDKETFDAPLNLTGNSDQRWAFARCRERYYCPFLRAGRLYPCAMSALVGYFNEQFDAAIPLERGIDIHAPETSGRVILRQLNRPIETCKWCSPDCTSFPWSTSSRLPGEWDACAFSKCRANLPSVSSSA